MSSYVFPMHDISISSKNMRERLKQELMPKHVAVIMDGNRRWAAQRDFPATTGHTAGRMAMNKLIRLCGLLGIKAVTVFAFSTENWNRTTEEVNFLMKLLEDVMLFDVEELECIIQLRVSVIGNRSMLPKSLVEAIIKAEEGTKANAGIQVNFAINYSGKYDIVQACRKMANKVKDGAITIEDINENLLEQELTTEGLDYPCPDLLIRTSGELRLSNFMLWQMAYSELYFVRKLFPDFGEEDLFEALDSYQKRHRRYGGS